MSLIGSKHILVLGICVGFVAFLALVQGVHTQECATLGGECNGDSGWNGLDKLDEIGNPQAAQSQAAAGTKWPEKSRVKRWDEPAYGFTDSNKTQAAATISAPDDQVKNGASNSNSSLPRSSDFKKMLAPIDDVSSTDVLLDISYNATEHIPGSIGIPYTIFLDNSSNVKSEPELVKILGDAGISREDPVVVYGECMPCGGGPAPATFVYWLLKSLGQENVRVLDETVKDWAAAGKPIANETTIKPPKSYASRVTLEYTASYDYVKSGSAQIVDVRTMQEFGAGSIPGAINIPYESVISNNRIKDEPKLERVFAILDKNQPVVVYTNTGIKASVVWFTLMLLGYDAKLYSYENWLYNQVAMGNATA
jgi:thiosulfate/3-mercaptopyruvate sulfurtransferase